MTKELQSLNGILMSGDNIVAKIRDGELSDIISSELLPLFFRTTPNLEMWLQSRAIDSHRTNSRLLKKALRLENKDDVSVVLSVHAATITDNYWIRKADENISYSDVQFQSNPFADLALFGDFGSFGIPTQNTPELTNIGSFEKCWRFENNAWWMYKSGTQNEKYSEQFVYHLGACLGFDMAYYEKKGEYIRSKDFTENGLYNYEPLSSIMKDNDNYHDCYTALYQIKPSLAQEYLKILWLDTIVYNVDRHTKNMGLLRSPANGEIVKMAPNFDNNLSLIARRQKYDQPIVINDFFHKLFFEFLESSPQAFKQLLQSEILLLTKSDILDCVNQTKFVISPKIQDFVVRYIQNSQMVVVNHLKQMITRTNVKQLDTNKRMVDIVHDAKDILKTPTNSCVPLLDTLNQTEFTH